MSSLAWLMHSRKWRDSMAQVGPMGGAGVYPAGAGAASTAAGAGAPPPPPKSVLPIIEPAIEPAIDEPNVPIMPAHTQAQQGEEVQCYRRGRSVDASGRGAAAYRGQPGRPAPQPEQQGELPQRSTRVCVSQSCAARAIRAVSRVCGAARCAFCYEERRERKRGVRRA